MQFNAYHKPTPSNAIGGIVVTTPAYLRPKDAARYCSVSERTLRDWQRRGIVAFYKPCRKVTLFAVADLDRAMQRFRISAVGEAQQGGR